ncbi:hypothetical protein [Anabaena lutea]|uniref:Uncharacterized protein n=1 Tax=Anabaena lutea FACHB-196 TaxID=2692881 RepID=A0ABR8FF27_9NOST|nr:hypothetical protein [Anabaena lutea]MBD2568379.1 hypothetical protein [Anabaena lutea FACHB-196]
MLLSIEGVYKHGKIELRELPSEISESFIIVTFSKILLLNLDPRDSYGALLYRISPTSPNIPKTAYS